MHNTGQSERIRLDKSSPEFLQKGKRAKLHRGLSRKPLRVSVRVDVEVLVDVVVNVEDEVNDDTVELDDVAVDTEEKVAEEAEVVVDVDGELDVEVAVDVVVEVDAVVVLLQTLHSSGHVVRTSLDQASTLWALPTNSLVFGWLASQYAESTSAHVGGSGSPLHCAEVDVLEVVLDVESVLDVEPVAEDAVVALLVLVDDTVEAIVNVLDDDDVNVEVVDMVEVELVLVHVSHSTGHRLTASCHIDSDAAVCWSHC